MRLHSLSTTVLGFATITTVAGFIACSDSPAAPALDRGVEDVAYAQADKGLKQPKLHYARVRSDGTLVDGTALSAERFSEGIYRVVFPPPIGACAAAANSASFQGFDGSVFRIVAQIGIGVGEGGAFDDTTARVSLFSSTDGASEDSSFTLTLVCP
jgi:hypothetical protein